MKFKEWLLKEAPIYTQPVNHSDTGMDHETGQIHDPVKYAAWQKAQKTAIADKQAKQVAQDPNELLSSVTSELSAIIDKNPNVDPQKLLTHVQKKHGLSVQLMKRVEDYIHTTIKNRQDYHAAVAKKNMPVAKPIPKALPVAQPVNPPQKSGGFKSFFGM